MKKFTFLFAAMLAAAASQAQVTYDNCPFMERSIIVDANGDRQLSVDSFSQSAATAISPQTISSFYFLQSGNNTYTYNCKDTGVIAIVALGDAGDRDTCYSNNLLSNNPLVRDNFAPTARCKNIIVTLSSAQSVTIAAFDLDNGSTDNCILYYGIYNATTTGQEPTKTYTTAGTYNEILKIFDSSNTDTCAATVTVLALPIAVTVYEAAQTVRIMPNPFDGLVRVELAAAVTENQSLSLYSLDGRLVQQAEIPAGANIFELNTVELPTGVYLLQLRNSEFQLSERIIKH
jgi:hypothetical protein